MVVVWYLDCYSVPPEDGAEDFVHVQHVIAGKITFIQSMNGYTFLNNVREDERTNWIPVLFVFAQGQSQDRVKGLNISADVYMVKSLEPEELVA